MEYLAVEVQYPIHGIHGLTAGLSAGDSKHAEDAEVGQCGERNATEELDEEGECCECIEQGLCGAYILPSSTNGAVFSVASLFGTDFEACNVFNCKDGGGGSFGAVENVGEVG